MHYLIMVMHFAYQVNGKFEFLIANQSSSRFIVPDVPRLNHFNSYRKSNDLYSPYKADHLYKL